jgi:hypothetical protein
MVNALLVQNGVGGTTTAVKANLKGFDAAL